MITLEKITRHQHVEYAAFYNAYDAFNLASNIEDDTPQIINFGNAGIFILNQSGFLMEIELLFAHPITLLPLPVVNCNNVIEGLPSFKQKIIDTTNPIFYYDKNAKQCAVYLISPGQNIDQIIMHKQIRFLMHQDNLVALEIDNVHHDFCDSLQTQ